MDPNRQPQTQQINQPNAGTPVKSLTGWKKVVVILILLMFAGFFILSGGFIFLPILIPAFIWYLWAVKRERSAIAAFAQTRGYAYQTNTVLNDLDGVIFQDPAYILGQYSGPSKGYLMGWLVRGQIDTRQFRMYEYILDSHDNNSRDSRGGSFDVLDIAVAGEGLQFLLISSIHITALNNININLQQYQLEGDFNRYFSLYGAAGAQIEILRIFTPDVMAYLIDHYQNYSFELTPQHFFIYRGDASLSQAVANCESLVAAATDLSTRFFTNVEKVKYAQNAVVPQSVQVKTDQSRIVGGFPLWGAIVSTVAIFAFGAVVFKLITGDSKIPAGYVQASDAKVSQDTAVYCQKVTADSSCSTTYQVKATFSANGQPYWYQDSLPTSHPVGSAINLYYNPANPAQADFVVLHSTKNALPVTFGFLGVFLVFVWAIYFGNRHSTKP